MSKDEKAEKYPRKPAAAEKAPREHPVVKPGCEVNINGMRFLGGEALRGLSDELKKELLAIGSIEV